MRSRCLAVVLLVLLSSAAGSSQRGVGEAWYVEGLRSRADMARENANPVKWQEIRSFWFVAPNGMDAAIDALAKTSVVKISTEEAARFLSSSPQLADGESLFLVRGVNAQSHPLAAKVYSSGDVLQILTGTSNTCFFSQPRVRAEPLVVALSSEPSRVFLGVSCDG